MKLLSKMPVALLGISCIYTVYQFLLYIRLHLADFNGLFIFQSALFIAVIVGFIKLILLLTRDDTA